MLAASCAAARRPPVDREAMREAKSAGAADGYASPKALAHYLRARLAAANGDPVQAVEELKLALAHDDGSPQLHLSLAELLVRVAPLDQAEQQARRALALAPAGPAAADAHLLLGKIQIAQRMRERAVKELRAAIDAQAERKPDPLEEDTIVDPEPWHLLGGLYLEAGDEAAADRIFEDLAARLPGEASGFAEMGRVYLAKDDLVRARKYLAKAVENNRSDAESHRLLGEADEALGRTEDARKDYETALRVDPDEAGALLALGRLSVRSGDSAGARAYFDQLLRATPDELNARVRIAFAWLEGKKHSEALSVIDDGIRVGNDNRLQFTKGVVLQDARRYAEAAAVFGQVGPDGELYASARANMAVCLSQVGRYMEAERALAAPMRARPGDTQLVTALAQVREQAGRAAEAIDLLQRTLREGERTRIAPEKMAELRDTLAAILQRAGRAADAVALLRRALESSPRDQRLLYALGGAYEKAGDSDAAIGQMKALLQINPDHADALNFVGYLYAEKGVKLDEAETLVTRALELKPGNGYFLDSLGWVLFKKGDFARAVTMLEKAETLSGPEATILEHLGDAYRSEGRTADAAAAYRRALALLLPGAPVEESKQRSAIEKKIEELSVR